MKKIIYILVGILIAVYIGLSLLSSGSDYNAERLFYKAARTINKIKLNPEVVPPALAASAENVLLAISDKFPESKVYVPSRMMLVELYSIANQQDKAIGVLDDMLKEHAQNRDMASKLHFAKGNIYEKQQEHDRALAEYRLLARDYNDTLHGVQAPLYIGDYLTRIGRGADADRAYNDAIIFYAKTALENREKIIGYMSSNLLLESHIRLGQYEEAGKVIESTLNDYPFLNSYTQLIPRIEYVYVQMLKDNKKAVEIYTEMKNKTEDARFKDHIDKRIGQLEK